MHRYTTPIAISFIAIVSSTYAFFGRDAIVVTPGYAPAQPRGVYIKPAVNLGMVAKNDDGRGCIEIMNTDQRDYAVRRITSDCGCITVRERDFTLPARSVAQIPFSITPRADNERFVRRLTVFIDDGTGYTKQLRFQVYGRFGMDPNNVTLIPSQVGFGDIVVGERARRTVAVLAPGRMLPSANTSISISSTKSSTAFDIPGSTLRDDTIGHAALVVEVDASGLAFGDHRVEAMLRFGPSTKTQSLPLVFHVLPPIDSSPRAVILSELHRSERVRLLPHAGWSATNVYSRADFVALERDPERPECVTVTLKSRLVPHGILRGAL